MLCGREHGTVPNAQQMLKKHHFLPSTHPNNCQTKDNIYKPKFLIPVSYNSDSYLETVLPPGGHVAVSGDTAGSHKWGRQGRYWPVAVKARAAPPNKVIQPQTPTVPRVRIQVPGKCKLH